MLVEKNKDFAVLMSFFDTHLGPRLHMSIPSSWQESSVEDKVASLLDTITLGFFSCEIASFKVINYHFEVVSEWARGKRELVMISILIPQKYNIIENEVKKALKASAEEIQKKDGLYKAFYIHNKNKPDPEVKKAQEELKQTISPLISDIEKLIEKSPKDKISNDSFINLKVVVVGEPAVGKTSLSARYATGEYRETYIVTIGMNFFRKNININGREVRVQFWDTGGQERYSPLMPVYYKGSDAAILVYDITSLESFEKLSVWVDRVHKFCPDASICIVGNKNDLEIERKVSNADGVKFSKKLGCRFFESSAKTGEMVKEMVETVIIDAVSG